MRTFLSSSGREPGPVVIPALIARAEARLGVRLPTAYLDLLHEQNGGVPRRRCFRTTQPTSWAPDHFEISAILGLG